MSRILVADDVDSFREVLVGFIRESIEGSVVDEVDDGGALIEKVRTGDYDLVLTDNRMKRVHGLEAIQAIRAFNTTVPIYLIAASSSAEKAMRAGATGYLNKLDVDWTEKLGVILAPYKGK